MMAVWGKQSVQFGLMAEMIGVLVFAGDKCTGCFLIEIVLVYS